jgi:putative acyl-CoA dehydrogenase
MTQSLHDHARLANRHPPVLKTHSKTGVRLDEVEFHPSYHVLMADAMQQGLHIAQNHVSRAKGFIAFTEIEPSILCPISMTYAVNAALTHNPAIYNAMKSGLNSRDYDARSLPFHMKTGLTMGMGMTEKQGGSDVRANITKAIHDGRDEWGERYVLNGHKWFFSAPMCDAFLVTAQSERGLSCFFVPRILPDGAKNGLHFQRLKDKLGNKANASSEVEFTNTLGWLVGEEQRGIPTILDMASMTRLDCSLGTTGLMKRALHLALTRAKERFAFGKPLIAQPLMQNVLADLTLEAKAAELLSLRIAETIDLGHSSLTRLLTPLAKLHICKTGATFAQEAMEVMGGNGYVEEDGEGEQARIYREMPLNSIWEGAGNIMALDFLRALRRDDTIPLLQAELGKAKGENRTLDRFIETMPDRLSDISESHARIIARDLAVALQAALMVQHAPLWADMFIESRMESPSRMFGTLKNHLTIPLN